MNRPTGGDPRAPFLRHLLSLSISAPVASCSSQEQTLSVACDVAEEVALRRYLAVFSFANAEDAFAGDPRGLADRTSLRTIASALPSQAGSVSTGSTAARQEGQIAPYRKSLSTVSARLPSATSTSAPLAGLYSTDGGSSFGGGKGDGAPGVIRR